MDLIGAMVFVAVLIFIFVCCCWWSFITKKFGSDSGDVTSSQTHEHLNLPFHTNVSSSWQSSQNRSVTPSLIQLCLFPHHSNEASNELTGQRLEGSAPVVEQNGRIDERLVFFSRPSEVQYDENCPICLEPSVVGAQLCVFPCGHQGHASCVTAWLAKAQPPACPVCRFLSLTHIMILVIFSCFMFAMETQLNEFWEYSFFRRARKTIM